MDAKRQVLALKIAIVVAFVLLLLGLFHFVNIRGNLRIVPKESWALADTVVHADELSEMGPTLAESKHPDAVKALRKAGLLIDPAEEALKAERARIEQIARDRDLKVQRAKAAEEAKKAAAERALLAKRGPKPEASEWDGITPEANAYLKRNLKDYDSMELIECSIVVPFEADKWAQSVRFRAKNGFGAYDIAEWLFILRDGAVVAVHPKPQ